MVFIGIIHCKTGILENTGIGAFHVHDDFDFKSLFGFCFQIWNFLSDLLLCYSIYDHWYQESFDSPDKDDYLYFFAASATCVFFPWFTNLIFLWLEVRQWQHRAENIILKEKMQNKKHPKTLSATDQSIKATANWLSKRAALLIVLCFLSGCNSIIKSGKFKIIWNGYI